MALGNLLHWSPKIKGILDTFKPDVIFHHGINGFSLISASRYIDRNPGTRLYVDCHTDVHNCKHNGLILYFQHNFLYRLLWQISKSNIKRTFYISHEVRDFLLNHYRIKQQHIEFLPLGGNLIPLDKKLHHKHAIRNRLDLPRDSIIFVHAGKLNKSKKTIELLSSFMQCSNPKYRLLIAGTIDPSIDKQFTLAANKDRRIIFLGWKSGDELIELLCAADCYVQPGTQSVTLQTALCCGTPVIVHPYKSHFEYVKSNGYFVENPEDLYAAMLKFNDPISIKKMENESYKIAHDLLDVSRQSLKYTETE